MLDLTCFEALTFDCYGTLIDWETGLLRAIRGRFTGRAAPGDDEILEAYARLEQRAEAGEYRPYRAVLVEVAQGLAESLDFPLPAAERGFLAESIADWPAFPDTAAALGVLSGRYRLAVLSNIDPDLLAQSLPKLGVRFDRVITAADVRSYKPGVGHFRLALEALDLPKERVLHVAQSLYHDIAPARALGWSTVWVNRRAGRPGAGATYPAHASPDLEVPDLATLAATV